MNRHYPDSAALRSAVLAESDTCLLSFSAGKDSVAAWIALRESGFKRVIPFYMYSIPGLLDFERRGIEYYERAFDTPVIRVPHPSFNRHLRNLMFQPPERAALIEQYEIPALTYEQVDDHVRKVSGVPASTYVALGARTADSPVRLGNIRRYGPLATKRRSFQAVYDWRIKDVRDALTRTGIKLTYDYRLFGRSWDGYDYRFLAPIKEHFPEDYERILQWYPLAHLELDRRKLKPG